MTNSRVTQDFAVRASARKSVVAEGLAVFDMVKESGLLRCAVPQALGGDGGSLEQLAQGARDLANRSRAASWVLWAQRTAIEAFVHSPNIGVREHVLPMLMNGERAGTLPIALDSLPIVAEEVGNAYKLYGILKHVPNLQWLGFSLLAPIQRSGQEIEWVVLRSEENGLRVGIDVEGDFWYGSRTASIALEGAFFRMDEWVNGAALVPGIRPVMEALSAPPIDWPGDKASAVQLPTQPSNIVQTARPRSGRLAKE